MAKRIRSTNPKPQDALKQTIADRCAQVIGSWPFIGFQAIGLSAWIILNATLLIKADPYPFILLNLLLSTQAAFATPLLLLSANRQSAIDRSRDIEHYNLDLEENKTLNEVVSEVRNIRKSLDEHWEEDHF